MRKIRYYFKKHANKRKKRNQIDNKGIKFQISLSSHFFFFLVAGVGTQTHYICLKAKDKAKKKGKGKDETDGLKSWKMFGK